jgi:hypothetical protein
VLPPGASETDKTLAGFEINPSINGADNGLHLVSAAAGVAIALWPADRTGRGGVADGSA